MTKCRNSSCCSSPCRFRLVRFLPFRLWPQMRSERYIIISKCHFIAMNDSMCPMCNWQLSSSLPQEERKWKWKWKWRESTKRFLAGIITAPVFADRVDGLLSVLSSAAFKIEVQDRPTQTNNKQASGGSQRRFL
mmetsp:Transcript_19832/g.56081  ORF Transcript_19832/g.56081 Transcript_19832/m.56081 type:complete len:134 (-) Transcript_19832:503-904(-)